MSILIYLISIIELLAVVSVIILYSRKYRDNHCKKYVESKVIFFILIIVQFIGMWLTHILLLVRTNIKLDIFYIFEILSASLSLYAFDFENEVLISWLNESTLNVVMFLISFASMLVGFYLTIIISFAEKWLDIVRNKVRVKKALNHKTCDILLDINELDSYILENKSEQHNKEYEVLVWNKDLSPETEKKLILKCIPYIKRDFTYESLVGVFKKQLNKKVKYNFISCDEENININIASEFINFISKDLKSPNIKLKEKVIYDLQIKKYKEYLNSKINADDEDVKSKEFKENFINSIFSLIDVSNYGYDYFKKILIEKTKNTSDDLEKQMINELEKDLINMNDLNFLSIKVYDLHKFDLFIELSIDNHVTIENKILNYKENANVTVTPFIHIFNRYELNAINFMYENPITKYLPNDFINTSYGYIENDYIKTSIKRDMNDFKFEDSFDKKINVFYLGFGKISKELYKCSVAHNQLVSYESIDKSISKNTETRLTALLGGASINNQKDRTRILRNHLINYYIFDNHTLNNKNKNNLYYSDRYNLNKDLYIEDKGYELPEKTHNEYTFSSNIDEQNIINTLVNVINNGNSYSSIIVSLGNDLDNLDYALKINMLLTQHSISNNKYHIFVRIKNETEELSKYLSQNFTFFGSNRSIFNHENIVNDKVNRIAKLLDKTYNQKSLINNDWFGKTYIKRKSSFYSALNLRVKLNMIGYDFRLLNKQEAINLPESVIDDFSKKIEYNGSHEKIKYEKYMFFTLPEEYKPSQIIAFQEKLRWNALYIIDGYVPRKRSLHLATKIKEVESTKEHACLTTIRGLDLYHKTCAELSVTETNKIKRKYEINTYLDEQNTYQYDYNILDNLENIFGITKENSPQLELIKNNQTETE